MPLKNMLIKLFNLTESDFEKGFIHKAIDFKKDFIYAEC